MNKTAEEIKAILNNYVIKSPSIGRDVIIADRIDEIVDDLAAAPPPASEGGMAKEPNRPWVYYPGIQYQRLSNAISDTNGIALDSEMDEIVKIVHEDFPATLPTREPEAEGNAQLCPKCNGQGIVSKPPWIPGDVHEWTAATASSYPCNVCNGTKVILNPKM